VFVCQRRDAFFKQKSQAAVVPYGANENFIARYLSRKRGL
jgi:hypothetical protein